MNWMIGKAQWFQGSSGWLVGWDSIYGIHVFEKF